MAAVKRRTGSGTIVALVIAIVIALLGIIGSLWFLQQNKLYEQAVQTDQKAFADSIGKVYTEDDAKKLGWSLPSKAPTEFGFKYDSDSYSAVANKLKEAVTNEKLTPILGWGSLEGVQEALEGSQVQTEMPTKYNTMKGLLSHYEQQYGNLKKRVADLEAEVDSKGKQIAVLSEKVEQVTNDLSQKLNQAIEQHAKDLADARGQFEEMKKSYDNARLQLQASQEAMDKADGNWKAKLVEVRKEADGWKELYEKAKAGVPVEAKLTAMGKVLETDLGLGLVILEGGEDVARERNAQFVIYTQAPSGARTKKADIVTTRIFKNTSQAQVTDRTDLIVSGDLFVSKELWQQFEAKEEAGAKGGASAGSLTSQAKAAK